MTEQFKAKIFTEKGIEIYHQLARDFNDFVDKINAVDVDEKDKVRAISYLKSGFDSLGVAILEKHEA